MNSGTNSNDQQSGQPITSQIGQQPQMVTPQFINPQFQGQQVFQPITVSHPGSVSGTMPQMQQGIVSQGQYFEQSQQQPMSVMSDQQQMNDMLCVKVMIEQYLQYYYTYDQIISELEKKSIPKDFTTQMLTTLIAQNRNYFTAYEIRVGLNDQIDRFNKFITRHFQILSQQISDPVNPPSQPLQFTPTDIQQDYSMTGFINTYSNDPTMGM